jgi:threonine dehydrogenase-like Zn-dependent dehydrogenase
LNVISEFKELEIVGGHLSPNTYPLALKYLSEGKVKASEMVTHRFPLSEFERAIRVKTEGKESSIKTILLPQG